MKGRGFDSTMIKNNEFCHSVQITNTLVGIDTAQLERAVKNFYKSREKPKQRQAASDEDLLFSSAPPSRTPADVDDALVSSVFEWLSKHPDIKVIDGRIITNEERIWQAIAGHGVDHSRIAPMIFECLQVIAAHGPDGILQPDLRRITGQDKRSLPHRTDKLAEKGYITKEQVIAKSTNTTLLKLRRFTKENQDLATVKGNPDSKVPETREPIRYDSWYDKMLELFKSNDNIIALSDLIVGIGIYDNKWHTRCFRRCYNRLVTSGLFRKVSARIDDGSDPAKTEGYLVRCLQMIREPEEMDRYRFKKNAGPDRTAKQLALANSLNALDQEPDGDNEEEESDVEEDDADADMMPLLQERISPQWTPDLPHINALYNIIDAAGPDGISSMALNEAFTGMFWRRPLDELMLRLTDIWQHAQPSHLKHFSIVKDTGLHGKTSHFVFRSLPNFEKAVELGQTSWKAVGGPHGTSAKEKKVDKKKQTDLDAWGFPVLKKNPFERNGYASLLECQALARREQVDESETRVKRIYKKKINTVDSQTSTAISIPGSTTTPAATLSSLAPSTSGTGKKRGRPPGSGRPRVHQSTPTSSQRLDTVASSDLPNKRPRKLNWTSQRLPAGENVLSQDQQTTTAFESLAPPLQQPSDLTGGSSSMASKLDDKSRRAVQDVMADISAKVVRAFSETPAEVQINPQGSYPQHLIKPGRRKQVLVAVFKGVKCEENKVPSESPARAAVPTCTTTRDTIGSRSSAPAPDTDTERQQLLSAFRARTQSSNAIPEQPRTDLLAVSQTSATSSSPSPTEQQATIDTVPIPGHVTKRTREEDPPQFVVHQYSSSLAGLQKPSKRTKYGRPSKAELDQRNASQQSPFKTFHVDAQVPSQSQASFRMLEESIVPGASNGTSRLLASVSAARDESETNSQNAGTTIGQHHVNAASEAVSSNPSAARHIEQTLAKDRTIDLATSDPSALAEEINDQPGHPNSVAIVLPVAVDADSAVLQSSLVLSAKNRTGTDGELPATTEHLDTRGERPNGSTAETSGPKTTDVSADLPVDKRSSIVQLPVSREPMSSRAEDTDWDPSDVDSDYDKLPALFLVDIPDVLDTKTRQLVKSGTNRYGGQMQLSREKLALDIVRQAGGATAGDLQFIHIYVKVWQSRHKQTPDRKTVDNAINGVLASGQLKKYGFLFDDHRGDKAQRHVIVEPGVSRTSKRAKAVQQEIMDSPSARFLASTIELEHDMCPAASTQETKSRSTTSSGLRQPPARAQPDSESRTPSSTVKRPPSFLFGNSYHGEFPTVAGITVKRTAQGIAAGQAEEGLWQAPRKSSNIRRVVFRRAWEVTKPPRRLGDSVSNESDEDDDDDYDDYMTSVEPEQAAGMGTFGIRDYAHDPHDTPARYKAPRPRPTFFRNLTASHFSRQDSDDSDTDNEPGLAYTRRTLHKSHRSITASEWMQLSLPPEDLQDVLERAHSLGYRAASPEDSSFWQFQVEIDNIMSFELALLYVRSELRSSGVGLWIDHCLNRKHVVAPRDNPSQPLEIDFVEGSLAVGKAEKLRATPKPRKRLRGATTFDFSRKYPDWQFRHQFLALPRSGTALHGTLVLNTPGHAAAPPPYPPPILDTPGPSTTLLGPSPSEDCPRYNTRFGGEGRPNLRHTLHFNPHHNNIHRGLHRTVEVNDSDAAPATPAERGTRQQRIPREERRSLAISIALINVLCGGADGEARAKWELVSHCHSFKQEANNCRQRWKSQNRSEFGTTFVAKTEKAIREPFLVAYERNELPTVNFQQLNETDWPGLMIWVETKVLRDDADQLETFPASSRDLDENCVVSLDAPTGHGQSGREDDDSPNLDTTTFNATYPCADHKSILEKSWIRALIATREDAYNEYHATQKFASIPEERLEDILKEMITTKSIVHANKGRQHPGRNFVFHKHFLSQFDRWPGALHLDGFLVRLAEAWDTLEKHFREQDKLDVERNVTEAESTVLNNLLANGRLRIAPVLPTFCDGFNGPMDTLSKWGMGGYSHKPRNLEESVFHLPVVYTKTASFNPDHALKAHVKPPTHAPAVLGEPGVRTPLWVDIHGNFLSEIWKMVLRSVLHLLVYRPGCTPASIEKAHDHKLWAWEVELVLRWMEEVGIAEKFAGGWKAAEWWFCAFTPEIVG